MVLEVRGKEAVVLNTDGEIIKIKQKNLKVGDTIELSKEQIKGKTVTANRILRYGSAAAAAVLLLCTTGVYSYNNVVASSYVSLDADTSIEYTLNRKNQVLDVTALNEEAEEIVQALKKNGIEKNTLSEAMQKTAELLEKYGYLNSEDTEYVLINVSCDNEKIRNLLKEEAATAFDEAKGEDSKNTEVNVSVTESSISQRKNAKSLGISSGEYQQIQKIKENETAVSKPEINADDIEKYGNLGVQELLETSGQIERKNEEKSQEKPEEKRSSENSNVESSAQSNSAQSNSVQSKNPVEIGENQNTKDQGMVGQNEADKSSKTESEAGQNADSEGTKTESGSEQNADSKTAKSESETGQNADSESPKTEREASPNTDNESQKTESKTSQNANGKISKSESGSEQNTESKSIKNENAKTNSIENAGTGTEEFTNKNTSDSNNSNNSTSNNSTSNNNASNSNTADFPENSAGNSPENEPGNNTQNIPQEGKSPAGNSPAGGAMDNGAGANAGGFQG